MSHIEIETNENIIRERYGLVSERIAGIAGEEPGESATGGFFRSAAELMLKVFEILENDVPAGDAVKLYETVSGENYARSYADPAFAERSLGSFGSWASLLFAHIISVVPFTWEGDLEEVTLAAELFSQVHALFAGGEEPSEKTVHETFYYHFSDNFRGRFEKRTAAKYSQDDDGRSGGASVPVFDFYYGEPCGADDVFYPAKGFAEDHFYDLALVADRNFCSIRLEAMEQVYEKHREDILRHKVDGDAGSTAKQALEEPFVPAEDRFDKRRLKLVKELADQAASLRKRYTDGRS
ncbi:MAG: hypothetical protein IJM62_04500 [Lachnospiraceae bacterium]|nr:hypothetical protein [Lachnospiraceae bacterium]